MYNVKYTSLRNRSLITSNRLLKNTETNNIVASIEAVHLLNIMDYTYTGYFAEDYTTTSLIED